MSEGSLARNRDEVRALAMHLYDEGRFVDAIEPLRRALLADPRDVTCLQMLAHALLRAGRVRESVARFRQIVRVRPDEGRAHNDLGFALLQLGEVDEAASVLARAVALETDHALAHNNLGNARARQGRFDDAVACYRRAIVLDPLWATPHANLGAAYFERDAYAEAEGHYRDALARDAGHVEAANGLGATLLARGDIEAAVRQLRHVAESSTDHVPTLLNFGRALRATGAIGEAIAAHTAATRREPDSAAAWDELAIDHWQADELDAALRAAQKAVRLGPRRTRSLVHLGNILADRNEFTSAIDAYRRALKIDPKSATARWNLALAELTVGDFARGWADYEARWICADFPSPRRAFDVPALTTLDAARGRTVLVHAEQGFGDTIQFVRFVDALARAGASVVLEVQRPLLSVMRDVAGANVCVAQGDPLPAFDAHIPLLSLPLLLHAFEPDAGQVPYLHAADDVAAAGRVASSPRRIGLVWSGSSPLRHQSPTLAVARTPRGAARPAGDRVGRPAEGDSVSRYGGRGARDRRRSCADARDDVRGLRRHRALHRVARSRGHGRHVGRASRGRDG